MASITYPLSGYPSIQIVAQSVCCTICVRGREANRRPARVEPWGRLTWSVVSMKYRTIGFLCQKTKVPRMKSMQIIQRERLQERPPLCAGWHWACFRIKQGDLCVRRRVQNVVIDMLSARDPANSLIWRIQYCLGMCHEMLDYSAVKCNYT